MTVSPSGFLWSLAILASSLLEAIPMVAVNLRSDRIRCFKRRANGKALSSDASMSSAWLNVEWSKMLSEAPFCRALRAEARVFNSTLLTGDLNWEHPLRDENKISPCSDSPTLLRALALLTYLRCSA